jgi:hypothetical protein
MGFSVYFNMKALMIIGREGDNVDAASVRKVMGEDNIYAAVSSGRV